MIDDLIQAKPTGRVFQEKSGIPYAFLEESPPQARRGDLEEVSLRLTVGVNIVTTPEDYEHKKRHAIKYIKFELYKDLYGDIHEALVTCQDSNTREALNRILNKIGA